MWEEYGYQAGPLPELTPVLKKWIQVNKEYVLRSGGKDAPWWYNERASLSPVAAAAWLAKGIALEEYLTDKHKISRKGKRKRTDRGRCDLYFSVKRRRKSGRDHEFIAEAKIIWPSIASRGLQTQLDRGISSARDAVRCTFSYGEVRRLGLLLITPTASNSAARRWNEHLPRFLNVLRAQERVAIAWLFTENPRQLTYGRRKEFFPGTAILFSPLRQV